MMSRQIVLLAVLSLMALTAPFPGAKAQGMTTVAISNIPAAGYFSGFPGQPFSVDISVSDVSGLAGLELGLAYNPMVMLAASVDVTGGILDTPDAFVLAADTSVPGEVIISGIFLGITFSGSGRIAKVNFDVKDFGDSPLDIHNDVLVDANAAEIAHATVDAIFVQPNVHASLVKRKAYPAVHHLDYSRYGQVQTYFAIVVNDRDLPVWVRANFNVITTTGGFFSVRSDPVQLAPGQEMTVSAEYPVLAIPEKHFATGTVSFSADNNVYTTNPDGKTFAYSIVL